MTLASGTRIGPYEIVSPLGAGGMGEVYRARDPQLGRDVAIKILPTSFAGDPDRLARFEHEARTLASLNHPNIAHVYGFEQGALVMELLEGETLRERLHEGPLPARKAIEFAAQIARGLAAAHERGVVHRDLKPENVFILRDGRVKILDFGLARTIVAADAAVSRTVAVPTITTPGTVMGTVGYMAPEQVRGSDVDARTDLFALGAVMYEVLAGQPAFKRDTAAETMTAILREDPPDLAGARPDVNPALDRIVRHCLEKSPLERFQTARDVAFALEALSGAASGAASAAAPLASAASSPTRERWAWVAAVVVLGATALWLALTRDASPAAQPTSSHVYRTILPLPDTVTIDSVPVAPLRIGICPGGQRIAYVGVAPQQPSAIWVQSLIDGEAHMVAGTEGTIGPRWSPDCTRVVSSGGSGLGFMVKIADVNQGTVADGPRIGYTLWRGEGDLIGTSGSPDWTVRRATGNTEPVVVLKPDGPGEPLTATSVLPDRQHLLVLDHKSPTRTVLEVVSIDGRDRRPLVEYPDLGTAFAAGNAIVFSRADRLFAQAFDPQRNELRGNAVQLASRADFVAVFGAAFAVADNVLVYSGSGEPPQSRLTWMDRTGHVLSTMGGDADYSNVELSPDDRRLAVSVTDAVAATRDIYLIDVERGVRQRLTFDPSDERSAIWSADGRQIIYNAKGLDLYRRPSDFTGAESPVLVDHVSKDPRHVSPDGRFLLFRRSGQSTRNDIWMMPLDGSGAPSALLATPFDENYGSFSPDGRSVVYVSDESGRPEVYVLSRESGGGKAQVSTSGGTFPRWRRDGREIVYLSPDQMLMTVPISGSGAAFRAGKATPLFKVAVQPGAGTPFDVTASGERFIVNVRIPSRLPPHLNVIVNWQDELLARARPAEVRSSGSAR
jgi:dipeptidyl aminopeptidase/acylaminoacyl peptidase